MVGAGPSGLSCAYYLTVLGAQVTILHNADRPLAAFDPDTADNSTAAVMRKTLRLTSQVPVIVAAHQRIRSGLDVVEANAMDLDWNGLLAAHDPDAAWTLVANLPYNVATSIVLDLLDQAPQVRQLLVMVQREAGERLDLFMVSGVKELSRKRAKKLIDARLVSVNGRIEPMALTSELSIRFLRPAVGERLLCRANSVAEQLAYTEIRPRDPLQGKAEWRLQIEEVARRPPQAGSFPCEHHRGKDLRRRR